MTTYHNRRMNPRYASGYVAPKGPFYRKDQNSTPNCPCGRTNCQFCLSHPEEARELAIDAVCDGYEEA